MSTEPHPAQELAELVAHLRQLAGAWQGVGVRQVRWTELDPDWPACESPSEESPAVAAPAPAHAEGPTPPQETEPDTPASLFPHSQPRPRALPPRRPVSAGPSLWAGYGTSAGPEKSMEAVREDLGDCQRCALHRQRSEIVFGVGDPKARLVVVGEAPGFHEDRQGEPFVGPAGQMLDKMLVNVLGLQRSQSYIINVLKCRPPDNRDPEPSEVDACRPFFDAQINVIRPAVILALGRFATQSLLDNQRGIKAQRGQWGDYRGIPVMPTFHPAYLLRNPSDKRLTLQDLLSVKRRLEETDAG